MYYSNFMVAPTTVTMKDSCPVGLQKFGTSSYAECMGLPDEGVVMATSRSHSEYTEGPRHHLWSFQSILQRSSLEGQSSFVNFPCALGDLENPSHFPLSMRMT